MRFMLQLLQLIHTSEREVFTPAPSWYSNVTPHYAMQTRRRNGLLDDANIRSNVAIEMQSWQINIVPFDADERAMAVGDIYGMWIVRNVVKICPGPVMI